MVKDTPLWDDDAEPTPIRRGEVRKALDRDLAQAKAEGRTFLATQIAAVRRQANDLDRLEAILATGKAKTWDYTPKTAAHIAYLDAVARLFADLGDAEDPFVVAARELDDAARAREAEDAARARTAEALDAPQP